jgi:hypothetical protein
LQENVIWYILVEQAFASSKSQQAAVTFKVKELQTETGRSRKQKAVNEKLVAQAKIAVTENCSTERPAWKKKCWHTKKEQ